MRRSSCEAHSLGKGISELDGDERDGIETLEEHRGLVHHHVYRTVDRHVLHSHDPTRRKNPTEIRSLFIPDHDNRLRVLHRDFLVSLYINISINYINSFLLSSIDISRTNFQLHDLDDVQLGKPGCDHHRGYVLADVHAIRHCHRYGGRYWSRL